MGVVLVLFILAVGVVMATDTPEHTEETPPPDDSSEESLYGDLNTNTYWAGYIG